MPAPERCSLEWSEAKRTAYAAAGRTPPDPARGCSFDWHPATVARWAREGWGESPPDLDATTAGGVLDELLMIFDGATAFAFTWTPTGCEVAVNGNPVGRIAPRLSR